jgi:penicillin amidase
MPMVITEADQRTSAGPSTRQGSNGVAPGRWARQQRRDFAIEALRGTRPLAKVAAEHGLPVESARRLIRREIALRLPKLSGALTGAVSQPVEIVRDCYGIPHVFGQSEEDLQAGLGFAVAQDRLWQLEYRRRWAYGTLAEVLGPSALAGDRAARTLRFDRIAEAEFVTQPAETRRLIEAYARGVNAAIAAFGDDLPIEFDVLGLRPAPWRAIDTVTIARASLWQFSGRIENIVLGEAAERLLPPELAARFLAVEAPDETIVREESGVRSQESGGGSASLAARYSLLATPDGSAEPQGSNQWAVGAKLSASGAPLLACDGHVPYYQPSTRYEVHLAGGGLDVIGYADAGMPLIHNGRTRGVAWGLTNNVSSTRDLYLEDPNPANPDEIREGAGWARLEARQEVIQVRGADPLRLTVRTGPRGPIVNHLISSVEPDGDPPLSLRWVGLEPRDCITGGLKLMRAQTAAEARETHREWHFSGQNPGFADTAGHIGYQMRGQFPVRGRAARGYRSPTRPDDDWQAPVSFDDLPAEADPPRGWIGSANQRPHPIGSDLPLYGAYGDGYRGRRIRSLLSEGSSFTLDDMGAMHQDVYSERAADLKEALAALLTAGAEAPVPDLARTARTLRRWDCRYTIRSVGASLFAAFWWRWCERVAAARFPKRLLGAMAGASNAVARALLVEDDFGWFDGGTTIAREVQAAMTEALAWLTEQLGSDRRRWTWGRLHPLTLTHALSAGRPVFAELFDVGPRPCPGGVGTLNQNGYVIRDRFRTTSGPHYRFLADLGESGRARGANTAGNSGNPASPHYADQFDDWLVGRYHPLWMDRAEIDANAEGTLRLEPDATT